MAAAGYRVATLAGRDPQRPAALARAIPAARATTAAEVVRASDLVLLTVPDSRRRGGRSGAPVAAGAGGGALRRPRSASRHSPRSRAQAWRAAACTPLQAFPDPAGTPDRLHGIAVGIEAAEAGGSDLGALLEALALDLGAARTLRLEGVDRARYHAAAVLASNDVVALAAAAARAWVLAGLPAGEAPQSLGPLLAGAAEAVAALPEGAPLAAALTGPVARGDLHTVRRHLDALADEPSLASLYRALGRELLDLGLPHSPAASAALDAMFSGAPGEEAP